MHLGKRVSVFGCNQIQRRLAGNLFQRVGLDHCQTSRVHLGQPPLCVHDLDAFRFVVDDGSQAGFAFVQLLIALSQGCQQAIETTNELADFILASDRQGLR